MHEEYDCPWQSASGAQSVTSPSRIEGLRVFEADLSALFYNLPLLLAFYLSKTTALILCGLNGAFLALI